MRREMSRRTFLGSIGLGALAWACAGGNGSEDAGATAPPVSTPGGLALAPATTEVALGDSRLAIGVFRGRSPVRLDADADVDVTLVGPDDNEISGVTAGIEPVGRGPGGEAQDAEGETQTLVVVRHTFETAGLWRLEATLETPDGGGSEELPFQVVEDSSSPMVGEAAPAVPSPTEADPMGVDPICTRDPQCSMHGITIADAVGSARPSVLLFATPRFCTSRTCGPVTDLLEREKDRVGDAVDFVHCEVWRSPEDVGNYPDGAVQAFVDYGLGTEPWVFFVAPDGNVRARWSGAWGDAETAQAIDDLIAGEL